MSQDQCATAWKPTKYEILKMKWGAFKYTAWIKWHGIYWKFLWLTRLAVPYSKLTCKLGWYAKFLDGRCHWCGNKH